MKKKILIATTAAALLLLGAGAGAFAASGFTIKVNGKVANVDARVINGSTYLPLKAIGQLLGAKVNYDASTRTVTVDNGQAPSGTPGAPSSTGAKSYPVNIDLSSGPMKLTISKVTLDPAYKRGEYFTPFQAIVFDVTIENTSSDEVSWYPAAGEIVTNTKAQIDGDSYIEGEYKGKVVRTGKIAFKYEGDLSQVTSLTYYADSPLNASYDRVGEDVSTDIILK